MTNSENESIKYSLQEDVRILETDEEIRLRKGIWNYQEACIVTTNFSSDFNKCVRACFHELEEGTFTNESPDHFLLEPFEREMLDSAIKQLQEAGFVISLEERILQDRITSAITGGLDMVITDRSYSNSCEFNPKILLCADTQYVREKWQTMAAKMGLQYEMLDSELMSNLQTGDLTTNIDAYGTIENMEKWGQALRGYSVMVVCMARLSINLMRNLNRLVLKEKLPVVLSFIDGPTISMLTSIPGKTACLECFEKRSLARMEDHVQYYRFVSSENNKSCRDWESASNFPLLDTLASMAIMEGYLITHTGASRFTGRLLNVYLPTLEIQVQNVLRAPFCEACGNVSRARFKELNVSSRNVIDLMVKNALSGLKD